MLRAQTLCQAIVRYSNMPDQSTKAAEPLMNMLGWYFCMDPLRSVIIVESISMFPPSRHWHHPGLRLCCLSRAPLRHQVPAWLLVKLCGKPPIFMDCHPGKSGTWP
ncbi:uncharacterized protein TrAFT101_004387 [Trichoderma asperellum]|uniref:uncharacterized protein n=1 Tax=Trichoderma asperellum TaxID=101201 RepID=UPI003319C5D0|nr:hypothetical protein TrAFT101_004387 [Trichoderma asperellum]